MGGIVTEEKHRITNEKTIELNSLDENQLFIGGGLFVVGIMNLLIFGGSLGSRYIILGSTFQFQGPSYFFSVGLIPLIIGLIFLIFAGLNARKLIINEKENQILIKESYFYRKKEYEIDKSIIKNYKFTNSAANNRDFLLLFLIPYFSFNVNNAIGNLALHQIHDFPITGIVLMISIFSVLFLIIIYIFKSKCKLTIYTDKGYYILKFSLNHSKFEGSIMEKTRNIFNFVKNDSKITQELFKMQFFIIGIILGVIGLFNIIFSHVLLSFIENLNAWLVFYVGIFIILNEVDNKRKKTLIFLDHKKTEKNWGYKLVLEHLKILIIAVIVVVNSILAIIEIWIGFYNNRTFLWRCILSSILNLILIFSILYYMFKYAIFKGKN
ncbi:MAG: hypothetical protein ACTSXK_12745 [Promethearchaeota archaeon]